MIGRDADRAHIAGPQLTGEAAALQHVSVTTAWMNNGPKAFQIDVANRESARISECGCYTLGIRILDKGFCMRHLLRSIGPAIVVLGLLVSPSLAQDSDDLCATQIVSLIGQAGLDIRKSAPAVGCRHDETSSWYMPTISETVSSGESMQSPRSVGILDAVDRMSTDSAFGSSLQFIRQDSIALVSGSGEVVGSIDISDQPIGTEPMWRQNLRAPYNQSMQTYLTRTAGQEMELVEYMQWFMARRDITLNTLSLQLHPTFANAFLSNWGFQQFPWPWQLADRAAIAAYTGDAPLEDRVDEVAPEALTPTPTSPFANTDAAPDFSPASLALVPGETADITVSLPPITFGGGFHLTVELPAVLDVLSIPQCMPKNACEGAMVRTDIGEGSDGSTSLSISGLLIEHEAPASFTLTVGLSDQDLLSDTFSVTAKVDFSSHSAPPIANEEAVLVIVVKHPVT